MCFYLKPDKWAPDKWAPDKWASDKWASNKWTRNGTKQMCPGAWDGGQFVQINTHQTSFGRKI